MGRYAKGLVFNRKICTKQAVGLRVILSSVRKAASPTAAILKNLETDLLDTGYFALETHGEEIASRIEAFLAKNKNSRGLGPASQNRI